jgi:hypothetical protein
MQLIDNDVTRRVKAWLARLPHADLRTLVLAMLIVSLGAAPITLGGLDVGQSAARATAVESSVLPDTTNRSDDAGSRSQARSERRAPSGAANRPDATTPSKAPAKPATPAKPKSAVPANPRPVAGLTQTQMNHAKTIVSVGQQLNLPKKAYVVAVATAMQESNLRNLANGWLPDSMQIRNDGLGYDHDSVGLFQQRPASGWGTVPELMDPATSARKFYQVLSTIQGWDRWSLAVAAQAVQRSAFPYAYAKHEARAAAVVNALTE